MKSEFKARPVYLSRDDRIKAHFTTCFISLIIYRFLEKKLDNKFTCNEIINGFREMNFYRRSRAKAIFQLTQEQILQMHFMRFLVLELIIKIIKKTEMKKIFKDTKK